MSCPSALVSLAAVLVATAALPVVAATPWRDFARHQPRETEVGAAELGGLLGWSPQPTQAPMGPPADPGLAKRYDKGSDTCGFAEGFKSDPWTCYAVGAECTVWSGYIGCCATSGTCSTSMITACYDYADVASGSCNNADAHTLCCSSRLPKCWAWTSTTSTDPDNTVTAFNCQASGGTGALFEEPPALTMSSTDTVNTKTTSVETKKSSTQTADAGSGGGSGSDGNGQKDSQNGDGDGDDSSSSSSKKSGGSNVGAIVGGVVGGLAVLALVAIAAAILWRKRRAAPPNPPHQAGNAATAEPLMSSHNNAQPGMPPPQGPVASPHQSYYSSGAPAYYDPSKQPGGGGGGGGAMYTPSLMSGYTPPPGQAAAVAPGMYPNSQAQWGAPAPNNNNNNNNGYPTYGHEPTQGQGPQELPPDNSRIGSSQNRAELYS